MNVMDDLVAWLIGCAIGFILGYIVRSLKDIKDELDEVEAIVKHEEHLDVEDPKEPSRLARIIEPDFVRDFALLVVVVATVLSAFAGLRATQKSQRVVSCNKEFTSKIVVALNERTTYSVRNAKANLDLQKEQSDFLRAIRGSGSTAQKVKTYEDYLQSLDDYQVIGKKAREKIIQNPYPTAEEFNDCVEGK